MIEREKESIMPLDVNSPDFTRLYVRLNGSHPQEFMRSRR